MTQTRPPLRRVNRPTHSRGQVTHRDQVLARRRAALLALGLLVVVSLTAALITGSRLLLVFNLVVDLVIGGYVALLLHIKQDQQSAARWRTRESDEDIRVVPR